MISLRITRIALLVTIAIGMHIPTTKCVQAQKLSTAELNFFETKIRPVLIRECYSCHSDQTGQIKGGLRVDTKARLELGGDSGPAIVPGNLDESWLWNAINFEDFHMPPGRKLPDHIIADFGQWIEMGAPDPRKVKSQPISATVTPADIQKGKKFWAFSRPRRPDVPKIENDDWAKHPIDLFIARQLQENDLTPAPDADPNTIFRRLSFDLIGLPPNPKQVEWFEAKWRQDPDAALEDVVDQLLASPRFGERWGRHWLDVARYAESSGREINATFPNAWRYRDYVIDAFNQDKPYDEFIQEQIAGDLLPAKTDEQWAEQLVATGFLAVGPKTLIERNARQFRLDLVDEQIDVSTRVILGVSVACARCHDHKFDPIPQSDYYAMVGIFESTSTHYGTIDAARNRRPSNLLQLPISDPSPFDVELLPESVSKLKEQRNSLKQELKELAKARQAARRDGNSNALQRNTAAQAITASRIAALESVLDSVDESGNPLSFCMGVQDKDRPMNAKLLVRGEFDQPTETVPRGFVQVLSTSKKFKIPAQSSGRLELARWMTDKRNPLTARVMVNRIWQHMMGVGLVSTPENFGATGQRPTHPELLDYLAIEFMKNDWSVKDLIREIALSRTYRMGAAFQAEHFAVDPENRFHWRANPRQLDAESLRDAMLYASGSLALIRPRGSVVAKAGSTIVRDDKLTALKPESLVSSMNTMERPANRRRNVQVFEIDQMNQFRSVYLPIVRDSLPRALEVFDFAEPSMVVGVREQSNTPAQGLYLLNNEFVREQSKTLAKRLMEEAHSTEERLQMVFRLAYAREATSLELQAAKKFYQDFPVSRGYRGRRESVEFKKLSALAQGIFASAEFRYIN